MLVPYAAGGTVDVLARAIGQSLSEAPGLCSKSSKIVGQTARSFRGRR